MPFTLRDYSPADLETLYEIDQACYPRGIAYSRRMLRWYLSQPGSLCIVAQEAAGATHPAVLGFLIAQARGGMPPTRAKSTLAEDADEGYIVTIDVMEAQRRSGIGTALLEETERRLAKMGVRYVELQTATNNQAGVAFWQRHGYRSSGVTRGYYLGRIDAYEMFKELDLRGRSTSA
jgi:[ribosomal protein S18]-alanine N-acetyltransferase